MAWNIFDYRQVAIDSVFDEGYRTGCRWLVIHQRPWYERSRDLNHRHIDRFYRDVWWDGFDAAVEMNKDSPVEAQTDGPR